jgi:hypothetical protein
MYIEAVQLFWPAIYVPICCVALLFPHIVMHRLIRSTKERTLVRYQEEIDTLLARYETLRDEDIQRVNTISQLFDRITGTSDYVFDLGIAIRTIVPYGLNLGILLVKPLLGVT